MSTPYEAPKSDLENEESEWKRSKWLTGWIWLMLIMTGINIPSTLFLSETLISTMPKMNIALVYTLVALSIVSIAGLVLILKNKMLGFWIFIFVVASAFAINFYVMGFKGAASGLIGAAILFALLKNGGEKSAWSRLR